MFTKLFVGGLPFTYTDAELRALLAPAGRVLSAKMVADPPSGRTRGFGFAEMSTPEEAEAAIAQLNGTKIGEKSIFVTQARERPGSGDSGQGGFNKGPGGYKGKRPFDPSRGRPDSFGGFNKGPRSFDKGPRNFDKGPRRSGGFGNSPFGQDRGPRRFEQAPPSGFGERPRRPYQGKRPFDPSKAGPGSFGPRPGGFQRPQNSPFGGPSGEGRRSFSPPRKQTGDWGPSRSRGPKGPGQKGPGKPKPEGRSAPKPFWNKFDKKKPRQEY